MGEKPSVTLTPYEVGVPGREFADRAFAAIEEEARSRGVDPTDPGAFFQLGEVGRALREIQGGERGGEAIERFGAFLFHAYHLHRAGEQIFLVSTEAARTLVEDAGRISPWKGALPADAGYVQLPRHLFWSHPEGEGPAEPLDGFFWTASAAGTISLLVAMGVRDDRPAISVVELPPLPLAQAEEWVSGKSRPEGEDFANTLPGGELDQLYTIVTLGEVLTLAGRLFGLIDAYPEVLGQEERSAPRTGPQEGEGPEPVTTGSEDGGSGKAATGRGRTPLPSLLPFRRIRGMESGGASPFDEAGEQGTAEAQ